MKQRCFFLFLPARCCQDEQDASDHEKCFTWSITRDQDLQMVKWDDSSIARKKSHVLWHSRRQLDRKIKTRRTRVLAPHLTDYCKQQHCLAQSQLGLQQDRTSATVQGHLEGCHLWEGEFKLGWGQKTA